MYPRDYFAVLSTLVIGFLNLENLVAEDKRLSKSISSLSQFEPPYTIVRAVEFMNDWGSCDVSLVDSQGNSLSCGWGEEGVSFSLNGAKRIDTAPGGIEDQALLKIVKSAFVRIYAPALDDPDYLNRKTDQASSKRWFRQRAVKHFIRGVQWRCLHKRKQNYEEH